MGTSFQHRGLREINTLNSPNWCRVSRAILVKGKKGRNYLPFFTHLRQTGPEPHGAPRPSSTEERLGSPARIPAGPGEVRSCSLPSRSLPGHYRCVCRRPAAGLGLPDHRFTFPTRCKFHAASNRNWKCCKVCVGGLLAVAEGKHLETTDLRRCDATPVRRKVRVSWLEIFFWVNSFPRSNSNLAESKGLPPRSLAAAFLPAHQAGSTQVFLTAQVQRASRFWKIGGLGCGSTSQPTLWAMQLPPWDTGHGGILDSCLENSENPKFCSFL